MVSYSRWAGFLLSNTFVTPRQSQRRAAGHHWRSPQQRLRVPTGAAVGIVAGGGGPPRRGVRRVYRRAACRSQPIYGQRRIFGGARTVAAASRGGGRPEQLVFLLGGALPGRQPRPPSRRPAPRTQAQRGGRLAATATLSLPPRRRRRTTSRTRRARVPEVGGVAGVVEAGGPVQEAEGCAARAGGRDDEPSAVSRLCAAVTLRCLLLARWGSRRRVGTVQGEVGGTACGGRPRRPDVRRRPALCRRCTSWGAAVSVGVASGGSDRAGEGGGAVGHGQRPQWPARHGFPALCRCRAAVAVAGAVGVASGGWDCSGGRGWHGAWWATVTASRPRSAGCGPPLHCVGCCWFCGGRFAGFGTCWWAGEWRGARPAAAMASPPQQDSDGWLLVGGGARCAAGGDCGCSAVRWMASWVRWTACQARRCGAARGARRQRRVSHLRQTVCRHRTALVAAGAQWWGWRPK